MMMMAVMMTVCAVMMIAEQQNVKSFSQDVPEMHHLEVTSVTY